MTCTVLATESKKNIETLIELRRYKFYIFLRFQWLGDPPAAAAAVVTVSVKQSLKEKIVNEQ